MKNNLSQDKKSFWPSLEEYNPEISKQDWKNFINEIEKPDHPSPMKMLVGMLALGGQASCKQLSETYGGTPNVYIGCTSSLGRRAKKYFNKPGCMDDGTERVFVFPFQGKRINDGSGEYYVYRMRPELRAALEEIDLSEFSPYYDEDEGEVQQIEQELDELQVEGNDRESLIKVRTNQGIFRKRLLAKYQKCCLCRVHNIEFLIASHIKPWNTCDPHEKLDVNNGFLLCPNHDKLFDGGWISFDDTGLIMISEQMDSVDRINMNVFDDMKICLNEKNKKYLEYHRNNIFRA